MKLMGDEKNYEKKKKKKKTFKDLMIQETLDAMQENKDSIFDNPFRLGTEMFFQTIQEKHEDYI